MTGASRVERLPNRPKLADATNDNRRPPPHAPGHYLYGGIGSIPRPCHLPPLQVMWSVHGQPQLRALAPANGPASSVAGATPVSAVARRPNVTVGVKRMEPTGLSPVNSRTPFLSITLPPHLTDGRRSASSWRWFEQ